MQITVQLLATYRRYLPPAADQTGRAPDSYPHDVAPGATVGDLLAALPFTPADLYTVLLNGRHAEPHDLLHPGDLLTIFPPAGGG
ncbi:MAG: MoaD/ThiS family protein [Anaerolineae bacterium]|nr:MoaD/ThiS family protein [Anaerolineae bacterium]